MVLHDIVDDGDAARLRHRCEGYFFRVRGEERAVFGESSTLSPKESSGECCFED